MTDDTEKLDAACAVESLLDAAKDLMSNAESVAADGELKMIAFWIRDRIESLNGELLKEVRGTIEAIEMRQALAEKKS